MIINVHVSNRALYTNYTALAYSPVVPQYVIFLAIKNTAGAEKVASRYLVAGPANPDKVAQWPQLPTHFARTRGSDDVSLDKLPPIYIYIYIYICIHICICIYIYIYI